MDVAHVCKKDRHMRAHHLIAPLTTLWLGLSPALAADMTEAERATFGENVRAYLLENPEVLVEVMTILQERQDIAEAKAELDMVATHQAALFDDAQSFVGGNPQGDVTIVEFTDYRCGYCRKAYSEVTDLIESDGNIRLIVKEFPILGEESVMSSRFAIAVLQLHGAKAYKSAHEALITLRGAPNTATLSALAGDLGLDPAPILARMSDPAVDAVIAANHALGDALQITGTPTFVVGDQLLRGYLPLEAMKKVVAEERG